ncbi:MAG: hypothetical protein ACUVX9_16860 [Anaerolineae bacterium]
MKQASKVKAVSAGDMSPGRLTASEKRATEPLMRAIWSIQALRPQLPLVFPTDATVPPSAKARYRSQYCYPGPETLLDADRLAVMKPFEVSLRLIDFSPLENVLAQHYKTGHKGQVPFHPVSMFLALLLRRELNLGWRALADLLAGDHGAGWRALLGFQDQDTPSASGLRYFFAQVGPTFFAELCQRFMDLLLGANLCSQHSTCPGDPPDQGVSITQDGMLHPARNSSVCQLATADCYQPVPHNGKRPCRARANRHEGCACDTSACRERCRRASSLDAEARFIHYHGHNRYPRGEAESNTTGKEQGIDVFGYRSIADRVLDDRFGISWTIRSVLRPANTDERAVFVEALNQLRQRFPDLEIGEWIDDAGVGYGDCLDVLWEARVLRMVDIRADPSDSNPDAWLSRGYDAQGHPLCPHGYRLHPNGYDAKRRRSKWVCRQACRRKPRREGEAVCPVQGCPYLDGRRPIGYVLNVSRTLPDGSNRLAREIPYGSPEWEARYGRRNHSESRNGQLQGMGLKRMRSYGLERNTKEVQMADFIINLRTMGRLLKEASHPPAAVPGG